MMLQQSQFDNLSFDGFRQLAQSEGLSAHERIGFPDSYRDGHELAIFQDIRCKLTNFTKDHQVVMDIGCGCSGLPVLLAEFCRQRNHKLTLVDSLEMLRLLPPMEWVRSVPGCFPRDMRPLISECNAQIDAILVYSVIQYVFVESSIFDFLDACLTLLAPGGQLLIGDIPNFSKRKRFFASASGAAYHREFTGMNENPAVAFNRIERSRIDDAVLLSIVSRARAAGFDSYVLAQTPELPMANRREDVLIVRP